MNALLLAVLCAAAAHAAEGPRPAAKDDIPAIGEAVPMGVQEIGAFGVQFRPPWERRPGGRDRWTPRPPLPGDRDGRGGWDRRPPFPGEPRREGRLSCVAVDHGWEEHWGGHQGAGRDLRDSVRQACVRCRQPSGPHGACSVKCAVEEFRGEAEYIPNDQREQRRIIYGDAYPDCRDAEYSAYRYCERDAWGRGTCRILGCKPEERTVLREECR